MKFSSFIHFARFGMQTILFRNKESILGTIIVTDKCNLQCKHCSVNNITGVIHPYAQIRNEMQQLYDMGIRILFFCGGETFLWKDEGRTLRDLVKEAKEMGFLIVNVVTNAAGDLVGVVHKGNACNRVHHNCNDSRAHVAGWAGLYGRYSNVNGAVLPVGRLANVGRGIRGVFNGGHSAARRHTDHSPLRDLCARRTGEGNDTGRSVRRASGKAVSPGVAVK